MALNFEAKTSLTSNASKSYRLYQYALDLLDTFEEQAKDIKTLNKMIIQVNIRVSLAIGVRVVGNVNSF